MNRVVIYIHRKGGNAEEATHYKTLPQSEYSLEMCSSQPLPAHWLGQFRVVDCCKLYYN